MYKTLPLSFFFFFLISFGPISVFWYTLPFFYPFSKYLKSTTYTPICLRTLQNLTFASWLDWNCSQCFPKFPSNFWVPTSKGYFSVFTWFSLFLWVFLLPIFPAQAFNIAQIQSFTALLSIYNVLFLLWFHPHLCFNNHMSTNGFHIQTLGSGLPVEKHDELWVG